MTTVIDIKDLCMTKEEARYFKRLLLQDRELTEITSQIVRLVNNALPIRATNGEIQYSHRFWNSITKLMELRTHRIAQLERATRWE